MKPNNIVQFIPKFNEDHLMNDTVMSIVDDILTNPHKWSAGAHTFDGRGMCIWISGFCCTWDGRTTNQVFNNEQSRAIREAYNIWVQHNASVEQQKVISSMKGKYKPSGPKNTTIEDVEPIGWFTRILRYLGGSNVR